MPIKKFLLLILMSIFWPLTLISPARAEEVPEANAENETLNTAPAAIILQANAGEDRNVALGRTVLFSAAGSLVPEDATVEYYWDFGDGATSDGIDATHIYTAGGSYRTKLTITAKHQDQAGQIVIQTSEASIIVSVQERLLALIIDQSIPQTEVEKLQSYGLTQSTLVIPIRAAGVNQEYINIQNLAQQILKNTENISASDVVVTWTAGNVGLHSFIELSRIATLNNTSLESLRLNSKVIVAVTNQSLLSTSKIAKTALQNIQPQYIVISDEKILDDVIQHPNPEELKEAITSSDANYRLITSYTARGLEKLSPLNFLSSVMSYMINKGVPVDALFLTLMLPVMATIIAMARQIVGIKALGIFVPTLLALSFLFTGIKYGIAVFVVILIVGTLARILARKFRLLYLPRMAIVLSILALAIIAMLLLGAIFDKTGFIGVSIFPILIMTILTEHFVAVQIEQGYKTAIKLTLETIALAILGYYIGDWDLFKTTLLAYPELILITFVINYLLGKFAGLRLTEYLRFRKIIKRLRDAEISK